MKNKCYCLNRGVNLINFVGMFDAYGKILRYEGFSGLYKGFWVSSVQIVSGKLSYNSHNLF